MRGLLLLVIVSLFVSSVWATGNHGEFVLMDPFKNESWSSVVGMKEGYRVFTNVPELGLTETVAVTHADGMYIAGEKVATVREVGRQVESISTELQATRAELQSAREYLQITRAELSDTRAELQNTRLELLHALSSLTTLQSSSSHPPACTAPGGDRLQFNGTHWLCVCVSGYNGDSCQIASTNAPTTTDPTTSAPMSLPPTTTNPTTSSPLKQGCPDGWESFNQNCYVILKTGSGTESAFSWYDARLECQALDSDLISIHSQAEMDFISGITSSSQYWLGLKGEVSNWQSYGENPGCTKRNPLHWCDGSEYTYTNWARAYSDCRNDWRLPHAFFWGSGSCKWSSTVHSYTMRVICKRSE